ncbi:MAG: hypothetical protein HRT61_16295, partial [Ekhidna sp.]|nr:hypothetical protein [Ekhidna sp.]
MRKIALALTVLFLIILLLEDKRTSSLEATYLSYIKERSPNKLEGPEKSVFREALMTMDPRTGEIPTEKRRQVIRSIKASRAAQDRDFAWEQIPTEVAGRTRSIMIDPNDPDRLWSGSATGGLWYTSDFRNNTAWVPVSDDWESLSVSSITYDPNNTQTFYAGTGESFTSVNIYRESTSSGVGIYKSEDGGASWSLLPSTADFKYVNDIIVRDENGTSVIYAAVVSGIYQGQVFGSLPTDGLYRSDNGGDSWQQVLPDIPGSSVPFAVSDIELMDNGDIYLGTMRNLAIEGGGYILHSENGLDWQVINNLKEQLLVSYGDTLIAGRVMLASLGDKMYALGTGGVTNSFNQIRDFAALLMLKNEDGIWASVDTPESNWASIPWHALTLKVDPNNEGNLVIAGLDVYATNSADNSSGGSVSDLTWSKLSDWSSMYYYSDYLIRYFGLDDVDSIRNHFV